MSTRSFANRLIVRYLQRQLSAELAEQWESHYLACEDCFEEMRATELLIRGLGEPMVERKRINDVTVLKFAQGTQLLAASLELTELSKAVRLESDTKVLIDLSRVSRIDSTGLGVLMNCYCHADEKRRSAEAAESGCAGTAGTEHDQDRFGAADLRRRSRGD